MGKVSGVADNSGGSGLLRSYSYFETDVVNHRKFSCRMG